MGETKLRTGAAALGGAAAVLFLLWPFQLAPEGRAMVAAAGSAHVMLFAGLAWLGGRWLSPARGGWPLWAGLAVLSACVEGLQPYLGRTAEWSDWLYGMGGAAYICATRRWRGSLRWIPVLLLCLFPPVWESTMARMEADAFPVLAHSGFRWARRGWSLNGVVLSVSGEEGFHLNRISGAPSISYPGFFREPIRQDWRGVRAMQADLFWPNVRPAVFAVRVDDRPGNPSYAERFQKEFAVTQGWNVVRIPAEEIAQTPAGRPLRLDQVRQWGVFLVSDVPFDYFLVGTVRLEMQEEKP